MPATLDEVRELITREFPGAKVDQLREERNRITGIVIWDGFKPMPVTERHRRFAREIRDRLGLNGLNVGFVFLRAPGERMDAA